MEEEANEPERARKEQLLLDLLFKTPGCVNQSSYASGGDHGVWSAESRAKIARANKRREWTAEQRAKIGAANQVREVSEATRAKLSSNYVGSRGKKFSDEARKRMSDAQSARRAREKAKSPDLA